MATTQQNQSRTRRRLARVALGTDVALGTFVAVVDSRNVPKSTCQGEPSVDHLSPLSAARGRRAERTLRDRLDRACAARFCSGAGAEPRVHRAFDGAQLVGFVNVVWDGGVHGFLLDTTVHRDHQRSGIGTALLHEAIAAALERGLAWLHVDFEPALEAFHRAAGSAPTAAGLLWL